jgi:endonuclease G
MNSGAQPALDESIAIDPDYAARKGYDADFLGAGALSLPLPALPDDLLAVASANRLATGEPRHVFPYHHFSVVQSKERRLAFFTAVNIDGATCMRFKRERDRWFLDPRLPAEEQTGEEAYRDNPLDRGHLVRRLDPAWGASRDEGKASNDDTFHFTNCSPQHEDFNQNQSTWAGLEDYILENADNRDFRASIFTGPVFREDDEEFAGVRLPREFWKVAVMVKNAGELSATAYLLSQESLIAGLEVAPESFSYGEYKTYQVQVTRIEELTRLSFGTLSGFDPLGRLEATTAAFHIGRFDDDVR